MTTIHNERTLNLFSRKAHYTLFVVPHERQNYFFVKKFEFCETLRKHMYTLFIIDSSCRENMRIHSEQLKMPLCFIQGFLHRAKTAQNAEWKICLRNISKNTLHTIRVSYYFLRFFHFLQLFANSASLAKYYLTWLLPIHSFLEAENFFMRSVSLEECAVKKLD